MSEDSDLPEFCAGVVIVRESCRYITASQRWLTLVYERPYYPDMPERCILFPSVVIEEELRDGSGYILRAQYPNGERETFTSFEELAYRFSARQVEMSSDPDPMLSPLSN